MKRLFWIGVGVGLTVVVVRYGRKLVAQYVPADAAAAVGTAAKVGRTARGVLGEFAAGLAEREAELRAALLGDGADVDDVTARGRAAWAELRGSRPPAGRRRRVPRTWSSNQLEDPDDDDGYAFF
jgi:hypothetical protein